MGSRALRDPMSVPGVVRYLAHPEQERISAGPRRGAPRHAAHRGAHPRRYAKAESIHLTYGFGGSDFIDVYVLKDEHP
jgi:hypothetical protein